MRDEETNNQLNVVSHSLDPPAPPTGATAAGGAPDDLRSRLWRRDDRCWLVDFFFGALIGSRGDRIRPRVAQLLVDLGALVITLGNRDRITEFLFELRDADRSAHGLCLCEKLRVDEIVHLGVARREPLLELVDLGEPGPRLARRHREPRLGLRERCTVLLASRLLRRELRGRRFERREQFSRPLVGVDHRLQELRLRRRELAPRERAFALLRPQGGGTLFA
mmetsp:Transcript_8231/g.33888  ORF Transcript_8231/g.33888 Transcript_8231/m.33888 type:complete len:222 (+) Transcript_8231:163-828(+)